MINERKWHAEEAIYRAVTGSNANFPDGDGTFTNGTFPTKGTIPKAVTKTGTIKSTGDRVRGTGTNFLSDVNVGDFIYDEDAAVRKVKSIESATMLTLESGFPSDLSSATDFHVCEKQYFVFVYAKSVGTADAELQEAPFIVNDTHVSGGAPLAYDASMANAKISFECHK